MAIIGIDLGTSNSAAAVLRGGRPVIIPSAEGISLGGKAFPSMWPSPPMATCSLASRHGARW
jgi:molecular chaperone DnaK (HSP70)